MNQTKEEEILKGIIELLTRNGELIIMMLGVANKLKQWDPEVLAQMQSGAANVISNAIPLHEEKEEWLDRYDVMDYKFWHERKFYRQQKLNKDNWQRKKIDGVWHYKKSAL